MTAEPTTPSRSFVGREGELIDLEGLVCSSDQAVVYVHGIPGIGKSALVSTLARRLEASGDAVLALDCRAIEPTTRGLQAALGGGREGPWPGPRDGSRAVLVLDHYEVFRLMDTWLRQAFVPSLPESASVLLASREPPVAGWFSLSSGFRSVPLGPLPDSDAHRLLESLGLRPSEARRLNRIARGHPLALTLAAAGVAERPELGLEDAASGRIIDQLARLYFDEVDDRLARRALEAASVVRRATEPLLGAMLEEEDPAQATARLLALPFVDAGRDGLVVHEAVREAIGGFLRGANPVRYRAYRRAAWRELREEVGEASPDELWRYTADMLYLIENPVVREAFFPSGAQPLAVEPARPADAAAIAAIARRHEPAEAAALLETWWAEEPGTFSVVRDRDGIVTGFFTLLTTDHIRRPRTFDDPVVASWSRHLRDHPLPRGQVALGLRRWLDGERGELPCASQAACWLDVKRAYMALRPALRRMYVVVHDVPTYWPVVEKLGFRPIPDGGVTTGGVEYASVVLDFGPGSVDGWLGDLVGRELGIGDEPLLDEDARELAVRGAPVALTPLEFRLFVHLRRCEGRAVSRGELLREVWGTDFTGGSNVVDAVVLSLRRKLGHAAPAVETVRGTGYRLRADWRARLS
ncbi:MAG TPA: winged helix-turn-helix domain-containing protein [Gaiellaceae bacterium]|nr:winged helix-turn-helix domain-containing protein [Gaiellaceae bacterium]